MDTGEKIILGGAVFVLLSLMLIIGFGDYQHTKRYEICIEKAASVLECGR